MDGWLEGLYADVDSTRLDWLMDMVLGEARKERRGDEKYRI